MAVQGSQGFVQVGPGVILGEVPTVKLRSKSLETPTGLPAGSPGGY